MFGIFHEGMAGTNANFPLAKLCLVTIAHNMDALEKNISDLPVHLLKDLLPILNIYYLDKIETVASAKGISTTPVWEALWRTVTYKKQSNLKGDLNWKQICMERIFHLVLLNNFKTNMWCFHKLDKISILTLTAHYVHIFTNFTRALVNLTSAELWPILSILENRVTTLKLSNRSSSLNEKRFDEFVLHRLLDHGRVRKVVLSKRGEAGVLNWILSRCQDSPAAAFHTQASLEEPSAKRCNLQLTENIEGLCREFSSSSSSTALCPRGQIRTLDIVMAEVEDFTVVTRALPNCLYLDSLRLDINWILTVEQSSQLLESLGGLFQKLHCSLTSLSLTVLCSNELLWHVLNACPTLRNLTVEITSGISYDSQDDVHSPSFTQITDLCLDSLTVKIIGLSTFCPFERILSKTPNLRSLDLTGHWFRPAQLFQTLAKSNQALKVLKIEDTPLAIHQQEMIQYLEHSELEELSLKDCRLLEKCVEEKDFLEPFVSALKKVSTLQTLTLARNRLAGGTVEIAKLFQDPCPSNITKLDLSLNFMNPDNLLKFAELLEIYRPTQRLELNLQLNLLLRDPEVKHQALKKLSPYCNFITDCWDSRSMMVDHVSVM